MVTNRQVLRIDAAPTMALMSNQHIRWERAVFQFPSHSVSPMHFALDVELTIVSTGSSTDPFDASGIRIGPSVMVKTGF